MVSKPDPLPIQPAIFF
jgi:hypothetical protein